MQMTIDQMILGIHEGLNMIRKEYYRICDNNAKLNKLNDDLIKEKGELVKNIDSLKNLNSELKKEILKSKELPGKTEKQ